MRRMKRRMRRVNMVDASMDLMGADAEGALNGGASVSSVDKFCMNGMMSCKIRSTCRFDVGGRNALLYYLVLSLYVGVTFKRWHHVGFGWICA